MAASLVLVQGLAVLQKNWIVTIRQPWSLVRDNAFPLFLVLLLCAVRSRLENVNYSGFEPSSVDYEPLDVYTLPDVRSLSLSLVRISHAPVENLEAVFLA